MFSDTASNDIPSSGNDSEGMVLLYFFFIWLFQCHTNTTILGLLQSIMRSLRAATQPGRLELQRMQKFRAFSRFVPRY